MLARLEKEVPGVETGWTNWTGTEIALDLAPGASRAGALACVQLRLAPRYEAREASAEDARSAIAEIEAGKWLRSDETWKLSEKEAKVLAKRRMAKVRARLSLDAADGERIEKLIGQALENVFREYHEGRAALTGGSERALWRKEVERVIVQFPAERAAELRSVLLPVE